MDAIAVLVFTFLVLPVVFCILFIVFLTKSIKRGKRIKELEKELNELKYGEQGQTNSNAVNPYMAPQQEIPQQGIPTYAQPVYIQLPEIQSQGYMPQQPVASAQVQMPAAQPVMPGQAPAFVQPSNMVPTESTQPDQTPTPSWALSPAQASAVRAQTAQTQPVRTEPAPKKKFFSSINITFGIGVLLLTIVGATFMTGSWPWMTEEVRAVCLVMMVFIVYGMSFFAGKILKLQQTEFALYTLASLLGPIVIVGMGTFNLLGSAFSFSGGTGWLVATVAALVLTVTSVGGRLLFKEKTQANIYQGTFYIALTWLVIFLCGQIGQSGSGVSEWGMICLGLATLALVFRIVAMTGLLKGEAFFNVYSEIVTYVPAGLLLCSFPLADGAVFGATIVEFAAFVLLALSRKDREWVKYLVPFAGLLIMASWIAFGDKSDDIILVSSITMVILVLLYAVHKILRLSTVMSDLLFVISLGSVPAFIAVTEKPEIGVVSCFMAVLILIFQMVIEPVLAGNDSFPEGIFRKEIKPLQIVYSLLATVFYYSGIVMLYLAIEEFPLKGHLYFTLTALIPVIAALVVRTFVKEDVRINASGIVLSIVSVIASLLSCLNIVNGNSVGPVFYEHVNVCSWLLTLAVIVMALFFMVKPIKEKQLSYGVMFWMSVCLNALSIGVFMTIGYYNETLLSSDGDVFPSVNLAEKIFSLVFLILNIAATGTALILKRKGKELISRYASGIRFFFVSFAMLWFTVTGMVFDSAWQMLIISVIFAALLMVFDTEFFAILPVIVAEYSVYYEVSTLENTDLINILCIVCAIAFAALGRLIFRKSIASPKAIDYLSVTSFMFLFGMKWEEYVPMMVFLTLALLVMNFAGRVKIPVRVLLSIFAALVCSAVVAQPFFDYPDVISLEINIILILGTLLLICKVIRPASDGVMKYYWFTGVALSLIAEGISAAVTSEVLDLIIVGTASFGIFIYAFIRRNRLWFILGIVSMISVAVYLSVAFWSSLVWLIYLFVAGTILVVMASINEWGKRHNKDGKKRRFFEEWTW